MDLNGSQALNLSSKNSSMQQQQQRNSNSNNGNNDRSKFNKNQQQQLQHNFDVLSPFGGDINQAVAALAAASGGNQSDVATLASVAANFSALAKLNPQNLAAILQLQQHQHIMNPSLSLAPPPPPPVHQTSMSQLNMGGGIPNIGSNNISSGSGGNNNSNNKPNYTRYQQLLSVIDEMGKDLRTTYLGNKNSAERLKRGIASARVLVKDCQMECDRNTKQ
jgi:hypothetical protein